MQHRSLYTPVAAWVAMMVGVGAYGLGLTTSANAGVVEPRSPLSQARRPGKPDITKEVRLEPNTTDDIGRKPDTTYAAAAAQPLPVLGPLDAEGRVTYFIDDGTLGSEHRPSDRELAVWALQAWERTAGGALRFEPSSERDALVRVHWVPASAGQYGEMRSLLVDGRRGAAVYVRPDTEALGPDIARLAREDPLLRDTIVYLTCLHELGHALGLSHTAEDRDIMYFFGFGGDIPGFFDRYRKQLRSRGDIPKVTGLSEADVATLRRLYRAR